MPKYPNIIMSFDPRRTDGNFFIVVGSVRKALREAGIDDLEISAFTRDVIDTQNYAEAIDAIKKWVTVAAA